MMGVKPEDAVVALASYGADVVGANCGRGIDEIRIIAEAMIPAIPDGTKLMLQSMRAYQFWSETHSNITVLPRRWAISRLKPMPWALTFLAPAVARALSTLLR